jgi:rSAM/selenodomain-associated transferase 2
VISVIIPALDEERALPATLERLLSQRGVFEVIVADGGSTDRTRAIAEGSPGVRVIDSPRGRASQMNDGASHASGEILLFLHADTSVPDGGIEAIERLAQDPDLVYGGFLHRFVPADWRLRLISRLHNLRCRLTGIFYGDQALFVRRSAFERVGGFPQQLVEDIAIGRLLRRLGRARLLPLEVATSSRKFLGMGVWRSVARAALILLCFQLRLPFPRGFFADVR